MFYLWHLFRSFQPLNNPIGFGASDFIEFALAAILVSLTLARKHLAAAAQSLSASTVPCMCFLAVLPIRPPASLLLPHSPVPSPVATGADDASFLLLADTLSHFRLANPVHPFHRFFETTFALQEPTYSSIFPMGQSRIVLAARPDAHRPSPGPGDVGFPKPSSARCVIGCCEPGSRRFGRSPGDRCAVLDSGPLSYWMNSYWGGAVSENRRAALVFGALPRLRREYRTRDAVLLGLGLGAQLLSRPFESIFLVLIVALFLAPKPRLLWKAAPAVILATIPAIALTLAQNKAVTGHWATLPYQVSPRSVRRARSLHLAAGSAAEPRSYLRTKARLSDPGPGSRHRSPRHIPPTRGGPGPLRCAYFTAAAALCA